MTAPHECGNCRRTTTNNNALCEDCIGAVSAAIHKLPAKSPFATMDEARATALAEVRHKVGLQW